MRENGRLLLSWNKEAASSQQKETDVVKYVVYEFLPGEDTDNLELSETIITITPNNLIVLAENGEEQALKGNTYVVTAVDRLNRESKPTKLKL